MSEQKIAKINMRTVEIDKITVAKYNPRIDLQPGDPDYDKIKNSVDGFGYTDPLILNEHNGVLISGHQRLKVLKEKGYTHVDVSIVDIKDEMKEKSMNMAMNNIRGREDRQKLSDIFKQFDVYDDLVALAGYEEEEFEKIKNFEEDDVHDPEAGGRGVLESKFEIVVECANEQEQNSLFNELGDRGIKCRVLTF